MLGLVSFCTLLGVLAVGTWRRPAVGVAAVLCLYGLKQWAQSSTQLFSEHREFANFAVFVIALIGLIRAARLRGCVFCRLPASTVLVVLLYFYALASITWSRDADAALAQWTALGPYVLTVALLAPLLFTDFEDARTALNWTAITGLALCLLALLFGHWGSRGLVLYGHDVGYGAQNYFEFETNPLALSSMAGTVAVIAAAWFARPTHPLLRLLALVCIPVAVAVILRTGSRGQLLSTGAALLVTLPIAFHLRELRSIASLVVVGALLAAMAWWATSLVHVDASRWASEQAQSAVEGRFENAWALLGASSSSPVSFLFGLGNSSAFKVIGFYPHITGLEVLGEEGILGAAVYIAIFALVLRSIRRIMARTDFDDVKRNVLAVLSGLLLFEFLVSSKQGSLLISVYPFAYAIILARLEVPIGGAPVALSDAGNPECRRIVAAAAPRFQNLMR